MEPERVDVTRSFLPPKEEYMAYVDTIWNSVCLTNQGPLVQEVNAKLQSFLGVQHFEFVSNGTVALMLALHVLDISGGEVITTPFSYVATTSSILWQENKPVFVDIDPETMCMDPNKIRKKITSKTKAIMPVHVFGMPCDVEAIEAVAEEYKLKVIYDGAHAFGAVYKGRSLLDYGDITTCSFHATKLFHTIEGGAVIAKDSKVNKKIQLAMRFGHNGDMHYQLGINGKCSEFHAAMGLANVKYLPELIEKRKHLSDTYDEALRGHVKLLEPVSGLQRNYAYYPVIFRSETQRQKVQSALNEGNIFPRRYFYPSLNRLPYVHGDPCPISEDIASRILCLPLYPSLEQSDQQRIIRLILDKLVK